MLVAFFMDLFLCEESTAPYQNSVRRFVRFCLCDYYKHVKVRTIVGTGEESLLYIGDPRSE